jgi:mediator of RNA polymerase II transcription subunit 18
MYEYALFGQVAQSRQTQLLQILAGVSAMPPVKVQERHLIFKPTKPAIRAVAQVGGSQAIQDTAKLAARQAQATSTDVYYMRLVEHLKDDPVDGDAVIEEEKHDLGIDSEDVNMKDGLDGDSAKHNINTSTGKTSWKMIFYDVPEPGKRPVTTRNMTVTQIEGGDAIGFMEGLGYTFVPQSECHVFIEQNLMQFTRFVTQFMQYGHSFTHHNLALTLTRTLLMPDTITAQARLDSANLTPMSDLKSLDPSGAYTLQASVCVLDASKPEVVSRATSEVLQFKETMRGVVDMRVVERLALDTRVK